MHTAPHYATPHCAAPHTGRCSACDACCTEMDDTECGTCIHDRCTGECDCECACMGVFCDCSCDCSPEPEPELPVCADPATGACVTGDLDDSSACIPGDTTCSATGTCQAGACAPDAEHVALMADHHVGYAVPIGGVLAYENKVSPSGVGFDIACGNKAVRLDADADHVRTHIAEIMDEIAAAISFGMGRKKKEPVEATLFDAPTWDDIPAARALLTITGGSAVV